MDKSVGKCSRGFYCYRDNSDGYADYLGEDNTWFCPLFPHGYQEIKFFNTEEDVNKFLKGR